MVILITTVTGATGEVELWVGSQRRSRVASRDFCAQVLKQLNIPGVRSSARYLPGDPALLSEIWQIARIFYVVNSNRAPRRRPTGKASLTYLPSNFVIVKYTFSNSPNLENNSNENHCRFCEQMQLQDNK